MVFNSDIMTNNISQSTNNYLTSTIKMNLLQNLLHPIDTWTIDDVQKWIIYCINEYSLGNINLNDFEMNGKALLLLNENGFKQRSLRSGDILHKALQQHNTVIKLLTCQRFQYNLWNHFNLLSPSIIRHINPPLSSSSMNYLHPAFNYHESQQTLNSSSSVNKIDIHPPLLSIKEESNEQYEKIPTPSISPQLNSSIPIKTDLEIFSKPKQETNNIVKNFNISQIRYYNDRIDFHGDILMKPQAAKNCRILWEFLYILLEDSLYQSVINWENREKMIFRIVHADKLAALWGLQKNRLSMTYEKLSRGMRYYYANNIISKEQSKRLLYRFMRSPDEIRKDMKRNNTTTNIIYSTINKKSSNDIQNNKLSSEISNHYLKYFSSYSSILSNINSNNNSILKTNQSNSSSLELLNSNNNIEKQSYYPLFQSSTKRKQSIPISLTARLSHNYSFNQPLDLAISKNEENHFNYKKQKIIHTSSSIEN